MNSFWVNVTFRLADPMFDADKDTFLKKKRGKRGTRNLHDMQHYIGSN